MPDEYFYLPGVLREIAEVAGLPAALAIAEAKGGTRAHFPVRTAQGHWLPELVGADAAEKICMHFRSTARGGVGVDVPLGPKGYYMKVRKRALEMIGEGMSTDAIARRLGVSRTMIKRMKASERAARESRGEPAPPPRQGSLF